MDNHLPHIVDPQVFIADRTAAAGIGPQQIMHVAGYRPAEPGKDSAASALYTAQGSPLGITLGKWLSAAGSGTVVCNGKGAVVTAQLRGLIANGHYQMTRLQFTAAGPKRTPLGQSAGAGSTFIASPRGTEHFSAQIPFCPAPTEGVVVAYVSDGTFHGAAMGEIGVNLHNQLAGRLVSVSATPEALPHTGGGGLARLEQELVRFTIASAGALVIFGALGLVAIRRRSWLGRN